MHHCITCACECASADFFYDSICIRSLHNESNEALWQSMKNKNDYCVKNNPILSGLLMENCEVAFVCRFDGEHACIRHAHNSHVYLCIALPLLYERVCAQYILFCFFAQKSEKIPQLKSDLISAFHRANGAFAARKVNFLVQI